MMAHTVNYLSVLLAAVAAWIFGGVYYTSLSKYWLAAQGKTYAYCADTKYDESIIPHIRNADLIYHETTYLDMLRERAIERFHSTSKQAALIAQKANVKKLLIGHFSSKYDTLEEFESEAREVFLDTEIATEGVTYKV